MNGDQLTWVFLIFFLLLLIEGLYCMTLSSNLLRVLIGLEILIKAVTILIGYAGWATGRIALAQQIIITVVIIETVVVVVGSGIILAFFRRYDSLDARHTRKLKG